MLFPLFFKLLAYPQFLRYDGEIDMIYHAWMEYDSLKSSCRWHISAYIQTKSYKNDQSIKLLLSTRKLVLIINDKEEKKITTQNFRPPPLVCDIDCDRRRITKRKRPLSLPPCTGFFFIDTNAKWSYGRTVHFIDMRSFANCS